jgi:hypothetical protein
MLTIHHGAHMHHTTLPAGSVVTTVQTGKRRVWGLDTDPAASAADTIWCFDNPLHEVEQRLGYTVCPEGRDKLPKSYANDTELSDWALGDSPDLQRGLHVGGLHDMAVTGYTKGVERLAKLSASLHDQVPVPETIRSRYVWGDDGDDYDVLRTYSGDFDRAFGQWEPAAFRGPRVITLYVQVGGSSREKWDDMFWRAAPGVVVAEHLQNAGFRVEMYSVFVAKQNNDDWTAHRSLIKAADEHVSLSSVAYATCLTAYFRMFGFPIAAFNPYSHTYGWGTPKPVVESTKILDDLGWTGDTSTHAITFGYCNDEKSAKLEATKALKQISDMMDHHSSGVA